MALGIPVIEDISQSAGASVPVKNAEGLPTEERKLAGSFGIYTILGLEERDVLTAGGGAVLMAPGRREWIVLKKYSDEAPLTDLLPDINCALAWVQVKEFTKCDGAVALRSPAIALKYALQALDFEKGGKIMISALAPAWQYQTVVSLGF